MGLYLRACTRKLIPRRSLSVHAVSRAIAIASAHSIDSLLLISCAARIKRAPPAFSPLRAIHPATSCREEADACDYQRNERDTSSSITPKTRTACAIWTEKNIMAHRYRMLLYLFSCRLSSCVAGGRRSIYLAFILSGR